ncbi:MAG: ankyrin repeat domain-containing protein [Gammaproteobacteria bacterium]|jgi:hypothetical protein|nr:ankyrin repeat domain-containing protein [Gammaproteobacteria bacterium]
MNSFIYNTKELLQFQDTYFIQKSRDDIHTLSLKDICSDNEDVLLHAENYIQMDVPANIEELIAFYNEPTQSEDVLKNNGLNPGKIVHQTQHPLHIAARDGDVDTIIKLLDEGFDINDKDTRNILPIHVAALFGQQAVISVLISYGADVNAKGYESNTALHFALVKQHYDVANTLVINGGASPTLTNYDGKSPITLIIDNLGSHLFSGKIDKPEVNEEINQIIDLLQTMQDHSTEALLYSDISEYNDVLYVTPFPASAILKVYASMTSSAEIAVKLNELAASIAEHDGSDIYINAKDLLHRFPTGEIYKINIGQDKKIWFISEGHLGIFTTSLAVESLHQFTESLTFDTAIKQETFSSLHSIYHQALEFSNLAGLEETAENALQMYNEGQTILLTSGWDGHFVDVILSKPHGLYIVANSGDRYHGESPAYDGDPAGIIFYQMHEPDRIDAQFMYNILNNTDKMVFEYENAYEYGIFEKIDEIVRDTQEFGNCGWESHRDAIEGILYIELLNRDIDSDSAKQLAHDYYEEWDTFHGNYVIDNYMENNPGLPLEAMLDIFTQLHQKEHFTDNDHQHAQKIAETFVSDHYIEDFKSWLVNDDNGLAEKLLRNILQEQHGIDIEGLLSGLPQTQDMTPHLDIQFENLSLTTIDQMIPTIHQEQLI